MLDADDLDLVSTEDLMDAIERRVQSYVLVVDKKMDAKDSEQEIYYSGGYIAAIGLCEYAKSRLLLNHVRTPPHGDGT